MKQQQRADPTAQCSCCILCWIYNTSRTDLAVPQHVRFTGSPRRANQTEPVCTALIPREGRRSVLKCNINNLVFPTNENPVHVIVMPPSGLPDCRSETTTKICRGKKLGKKQIALCCGRYDVNIAHCILLAIARGVP